MQRPHDPVASSHDHGLGEADVDDLALDEADGDAALGGGTRTGSMGVLPSDGTATTGSTGFGGHLPAELRPKSRLTF